MDKIWNKLKSDLTKLTHFLVGTKPLILKKKDEINTDLKHLKKQTKAQLEKLGRKIGIELDKRFTKEKLIKKIRKHIK